jgi:hypothetical protein
MYRAHPGFAPPRGHGLVHYHREHGYPCDAIFQQPAGLRVEATCRPWLFISWSRFIKSRGPSPVRRPVNSVNPIFDSEAGPKILDRSATRLVYVVAADHEPSSG